MPLKSIAWGSSPACRISSPPPTAESAISVSASYPAATRHAVAATGGVRSALERQLLLVYLGRTHDSSAIHEDVIGSLDRQGSGRRAALDDLRAAATAARDAVEAGDLAALGEAMRANTEAQRRLHPSLVGADAQRVIEAVTSRGALGWKVNGAGGEGDRSPSVPARGR